MAVFAWGQYPVSRLLRFSNCSSRCSTVIVLPPSLSPPTVYEKPPSHPSGWRGHCHCICGGDARQAAPTTLSAAGGRGQQYSALIFPQESNWRMVGFSPISKPQCSPKILPSISSSTESATTGKSRFARALPRRPHRAGQLPRRPQVDGDDQALRPCERRAIWCGY